MRRDLTRKTLCRRYIAAIGECERVSPLAPAPDIDGVRRHLPALRAIALNATRASSISALSDALPRERHSNVAYTEAQLTALRAGLTAEEYRWKLIREWGEK